MCVTLIKKKHEVLKMFVFSCPKFQSGVAIVRVRLSFFSAEHSVHSLRNKTNHNTIVLEHIMLPQ